MHEAHVDYLARIVTARPTHRASQDTVRLSKHGTQTSGQDDTPRWGNAATTN